MQQTLRVNVSESQMINFALRAAVTLILLVRCRHCKSLVHIYILQCLVKHHCRASTLPDFWSAIIPGALCVHTAPFSLSASPLRGCSKQCAFLTLAELQLMKDPCQGLQKLLQIPSSASMKWDWKWFYRSRAPRGAPRLWLQGVLCGLGNAVKEPASSYSDIVWQLSWRKCEELLTVLFLSWR